jgi:hypothetical protein
MVAAAIGVAVAATVGIVWHTFRAVPLAGSVPMAATLPSTSAPSGVGSLPTVPAVTPVVRKPVVPPVVLANPRARAADVKGTTIAPRLELARADEEKTLTAAKAAPVRFDTAFECGTPDVKGETLSPDHVAVHLPTRRFAFQLHGIKGRTVRVDLVRDGTTGDPGGRTNPLFSYASDPSDPADYDHGDGDTEAAAGGSGWNGAQLPATDGQSWHFAKQVWNSAPGVMSFVQTFTADDVTIAEHIPRPPSYNEKFFAGLAGNPHVRVIDLGKTPGGRPLLMAKLGPADPAAERDRPTVLVYSGEHSDANDSMWVGEGTLAFLAGDSDTAAGLRDRFNFLVIPTLDPDATADGDHGRIIVQFKMDGRMPENIAYANWFEDWINTGHRVDVAVDLDGGTFATPADVACYAIEGKGNRGGLALQLVNGIADAVRSAGYVSQHKPWQRGWAPQRLGGWCTRRFGTFWLSYGVDSQNLNRHLNLTQLKGIGGAMVIGITNGLDDPQLGPRLRGAVDDGMRSRLVLLKKFRPREAGEDAILYEGKAAVADPADWPVVEQETVIH